MPWYPDLGIPKFSYLKQGADYEHHINSGPPDFQSSSGSADIYRVWCAKQQPLLATSGALHFLVSSKHPVDSVSSTSGLS